MTTQKLPRDGAHEDAPDSVPHAGPVGVDPRTVIDLFAGAGGLSYAFHQEGFHVVACVENDASALATYRHSMVEVYSPETVIIDSDVRERSVPPRLLAALAGRQLDVLVGGPPCQDFSPACLSRKRREDRMILVRDYLRLLSELRPEVFLFENVPGLLSADEGSHWSFIQREVTSLGYAVDHQLLNAEDFGVPQRRRRLFVVGVTASRMGHFTFPVGDAPRVTVRAAIAKLKPLRAGFGDRADPDHRARSHRPHIVEYLKQIPPGGSWRSRKDLRVLPCHAGHNGHYDVYGRIAYDDVSPTITGGCTNPSRGRFIHPTQHRGLTVREAALLQTFPRTWHFHGGIESASQQVGNAVPIELGRALARSVREALRTTPGQATSN